MGSKCAKSSKNNTPPPSEVTQVTGSELRQIIKKSLGDGVCCHIVDGDYGCYSKEDLERFLKSDNVDQLKYHAERFDCDNFALALAGREAEWYSTRSDKLGSGFGIVHGDIRKSEEDTKKRPHAINYLVDDGGELWLIEPQNDKIFKPTSNSTFWFTLG